MKSSSVVVGAIASGRRRKRRSTPHSLQAEPPHTFIESVTASVSGRALDLDTRGVASGRCVFRTSACR